MEVLFLKLSLVRTGLVEGVFSIPLLHAVNKISGIDITVGVFDLTTTVETTFRIIFTFVSVEREKGWGGGGLEEGRERKGELNKT